MSDMRDDIRKIKAGIDKLNCCDTQPEPLDIQPIVDGLQQNNDELSDINVDLDAVNNALSDIEAAITDNGLKLDTLNAEFTVQQKWQLRGFTASDINGKTLEVLITTAYTGIDLTKIRSIKILVPTATTISLSIQSGATNMDLTPGHIFVFEGSLRDTVLTDLTNVVFSGSGTSTEKATIWFELYS